MQLLSRYLVDNTTTLVADVAGFITEYRPVYNRGIEVYKGIDNALQFRLLNADQKPVNVATGYTPKFEAYDETGRLLITRDCTIQDDGSTVTRGKFKLTISENDLKNVKQQFLSYIVYLVETDGDKVLTYSQSNFKNNGTIFVNAKALPGPNNSITVTTLTETNASSEIWVTQPIGAEPGINGNEALHTAAIYPVNFAGTGTVQATLANQVTSGTPWADVATQTLIGTETWPVSVNFNGVFTYVRFKTTVDPTDKITKILVRN
jgi:hypothetical protein